MTARTSDVPDSRRNRASLGALVTEAGALSNVGTLAEFAGVGVLADSLKNVVNVADFSPAYDAFAGVGVLADSLKNVVNVADFSPAYDAFAGVGALADSLKNVVNVADFDAFARVGLIADAFKDIGVLPDFTASATEMDFGSLPDFRILDDLGDLDSGPHLGDEVSLLVALRGLMGSPGVTPNGHVLPYLSATGGLTALIHAALQEYMPPSSYPGELFYLALGISVGLVLIWCTVFPPRESGDK